METVAPRAVPPGPTVSAPPPTAQLSSPPPELQRLEIGAKINAQVLAATTKGFADVSSPFGKLQIATNFPLPANTPLQFQVIGKFPLFQLLITSVQGQSPQTFLRTVLQDGPDQPGTAGSAGKAATPGTGTGTPSGVGSGRAATGSTRPAPAALTLTVGTNVIATKIGAGSLLASPGTGGQTVQAGAPAGAPLASPASGASGAAASPIAAAGATGDASSRQPAAPAGRTAGPQAGTGAGNLNQTGSRFSVRIVQVLPPSQLSAGGGLPSTGSPLFANGQTVTGVVTSTTAQGLSVVQTHAGPVTLAAPSPLPPGTTVSFLINGPLPASQGLSAPGWADRNAAVIMETHKWPILEDALRSLTESQPSVAQQVTNVLLPKADATLAANILLLLAAIRGGDIRGWFGDAPVRTLQRLRPDIMNRLQDDFAQMSRLADDSSGNDWRSYPVPFLNGQAIEQIRFHIKRRAQEDDDGADADPGTRFVIDLDLSHLGRLQLEGLVKSEKKQFDLIIRTDQHLAPELQNAIRNIFQNAQDQTQNTGGLTFQAAPANFLDIQVAAATSADPGLIV